MLLPQNEVINTPLAKAALKRFAENRDRYFEKLLGLELRGATVKIPFALDSIIDMVEYDVVNKKFLRILLWIKESEGVYYWQPIELDEAAMQIVEEFSKEIIEENKINNMESYYIPKIEEFIDGFVYEIYSEGCFDENIEDFAGWYEYTMGKDNWRTIEEIAEQINLGNIRVKTTHKYSEIWGTEKRGQ